MKTMQEFYTKFDFVIDPINEVYKFLVKHVTIGSEESDLLDLIARKNALLLNFSMKLQSELQRVSPNYLE